MRLFGLSTLRRLSLDRRGNALMITAFTLPLILGAAGLGVHSIQLSLTKRQMQREADSAALAGAFSLYQDRSDTEAEAAATQALTQNALVSGVTPTIEVTGSYTSGDTTYSETMFVRLTHNEPTPFMSLFGMGTTAVTAEARAATAPIGDFCFLALEEGSTTGITFSGNSTLDMDCGVATNSTNGSQAMKVNGNPTVLATPLVARGQIENASALSGSTQMENHDYLTNPLSDSYDPSINSSANEVDNKACKSGTTWNSISVASNTTVDMSTTHGGCFSTINVQGTLTLGSGTYYLVGSGNSAGLRIGAQANFTCNQCAFVLTTTTNPPAPSGTGNQNTFNNAVAQVSINGGATVNLTPPTSGTYSGITMYRDGRVTNKSNFTINGNSSSILEGAFYFPDDNLMFNGTSGMQLTCFLMVAKTLEFSGTADINNSCSKPGDPNAWSVNKVRLIS